MAIDSQPSMGQLEEQASHHKEQLEKMGFEVVGVDIRKNADGHSYILHHNIDYERSIRYNLSWNLRADQNLATRLIGLLSDLESTQINYTKLTKAYKVKADKVSAVDKSVTELKCVLRDNPGVAEQLDETLTMLKLAGWDNRLFS